MTIANVSLTNTFDEWRTITNQLVIFANDYQSVNVRFESIKTNAVFNQSNTIYSLTNSAFIQANTARTGANSAGDIANSAFNAANTYYATVFTQANTARTGANTVGGYANAAFLQANTVYLYANAINAQANTGRDHANLSFAQANAAFTKANNAITDFSPAFNQANTARDGANTVGGYANAAFLQANVARAAANTVGDYANSAFLQANTARAGANTVGGYANAAFLTANVGFSVANIAYSQANTGFSSANTYYVTTFSAANTAQITAVAAFAKANTIGTLGTQASGSVSISGGSITGISTLQSTSYATSGDTLNRFQVGAAVLRGGSPTFYFRDTDGSSAMLHNNSNLFYVLRGGADTESWTQVGGQWPVTINLNDNSFTGGGSIFAVGDIAAFYSDVRLKTDIVPIKDALFKVKQINGITYRNNELAESYGFETEKTHVGVLAHEVQAVLPEVIAPAPFDRDANTGESRSGENYITVKYEKIVPLLIEAIKELSDKVDVLTQQIEEFKK